jgi:hypothetical protein
MGGYAGLRTWGGCEAALFWGSSGSDGTFSDNVFIALRPLRQRHTVSLFFNLQDLL